MAMPPDVRERYERYRSAERTWDPERGGKRPALAWDDDKTVGLGEDLDGRRFQAIGDRMLGGHYYPPDVIDCFGPWMDEDREIRAGDRMLQRARVLPFAKWPVLWAMTEVFIAERTETFCTLGYVTTRKHFGRGIWQATLTRKDRSLGITVRGVSGPASWLFWLGLPFARWLQKRAWRRAIEEFASVGGREPLTPVGGTPPEGA